MIFFAYFCHFGEICVISYINSSSIYTIAHETSDTTNMLVLRHARISATTNPIPAATILLLAVRIAGNVITASVTYGT